jgi:tetratricopeptide (TPR) repeat protein
MKNLLLILITFTFSVGLAIAQNPEKDMKKAGKLLGSYFLDPANRADKLDEAKALIDAAMATEEMSASSTGWNTKGDIYTELAAKEAAQTALDPNFSPSDAGIIALSSYEEGLKQAVKKYEKKDALKGMAGLSNNLNTIGFSEYQKSNFLSAFKYFDGVLQVNKMLKENDMNPILKDEKSINDQMYIAGVAAMSGGDMMGTKRYFSILKDKNFDKAVIYDGLYQAYKDEDEAKAVGFLEEGRERFPDNKSLLFQEINHYLNKGELESLVSKLENAMELEPDNASIVTTLGNIYDQQYQTALEGDDEAKTQELFDKAYAAYEKALAIAPGDFAATYSLGALYYNKAASVSKQVNILAEDYSKEGTKKYEAAKEEMNKLFEQALPFFEKAEKIEPNDKNTLIALKEIYARQNDFEKSNAYKAKIDALGN